jgi:hypothetical protein
MESSSWPAGEAAQLQEQQEQPQLVPHLQVVQSQPPFSASAIIVMPPELPLLVAAAMTMVVVVADASTSGNILQLHIN